MIQLKEDMNRHRLRHTHNSLQFTTLFFSSSSCTHIYQCVDVSQQNWLHMI